MLKFWAFALLNLIHGLIHAQFSDSFTDGDFTSQPTWDGDGQYFTVNTQGELQSQGPNATSSLYLSTPSALNLNASWSFTVRLDLGLSTTNYANVYLCSSEANLEEALNGYYLRLGGISGNADAIELYRQEGLVATKIAGGSPGLLGKTSNNRVNIRVLRNTLGHWWVYADTSGSNQYKLECTVMDNNFTATAYAGIVIKHTATRRNQFYFDDFEVRNAPLMPIKAEAEPPNALVITFNKSLSLPEALVPDHYKLQSGSPAQQLQVENHIVRMQFDQAWQNNHSYTLYLSGLHDVQGDTMGPIRQMEFTYVRAVHAGDLLVTEILPDPLPRLALPGEEFVELYNATNDTLNLNSFSLEDESTICIFPTYFLPPQTYLVLCAAANVHEFSAYPKVLGLNDFLSLNNASDRLRLRNTKAESIQELAYNDTWYRDQVKAEGGWSLEMIDLNNVFGEEHNWTASLNPSGGSPGFSNSVKASLPDTSPPEWLRWECPDSLHVILWFDEKLDNLNLTQVNISLEPSPGSITLKSSALSNRALEVNIAQGLERNKVYRLHLQGLKDCNGNTTSALMMSVVLPEPVRAGDLWINEVLFNPVPYGHDFVELYNASSHFLDLKTLRLGRRDQGVLTDLQSLSNSSYLLAPGTYTALTEDAIALKNQYPRAGTIWEVAHMPSLPDDEGSVVLLDSLGNILDEMHYSDGQQHPLLKSHEGISLERLSVSQPSSDQANWHSASSESMATPGYANSQSQPGSGVGEWTIEPRTFTPNLDGDRDFTSVVYKLQEAGYTATLLVLDAAGYVVRHLAEQTLLGSEGQWIWDGTDDQARVLQTGYYLIYAELVHPNGKVKKFRETVAIGW